MNSEEIEQLKQRLYEKLEPSGWASKLKGFILSADMDKLLRQLDQEVVSGERFVPGFKYVFNAFYQCPWDNIKVVILGQSPFPYQDVCDGMAFSCGLKRKPLPSLRYIFADINKTVYPHQEYEADPDLTRWANQGVLLLNSALTTRLGTTDTHFEIWEPFIKYTLDMINSYNPGLVYCFLGKKAQEFAPGLNNNNYKILATHPASAAHNNQEVWDSRRMWEHINRILKANNNTEITW